MAAGPPSASTSPSHLSPNHFLKAQFNGSSPPKFPFSTTTMTADVFSATAAPLSHGYTLSPIGERESLENGTSPLFALPELESSISNPETKYTPTILVRKLPRNTSDEAVRSMLLFAKDLLSTEVVRTDFPEDKGYSTALARFRSIAGAEDAREKLNGKPNAANDGKMVVEILPSGGLPAVFGARRNTVDGTASRQTSGSNSSAASSTGRQSSRFNGTFQSLEKLSPPNGALGNGDFSLTDTGLFSPKSPVANPFGERSQNLSKQLINDDAGDDETNELIKDPVAYARSGQNGPTHLGRRTTTPQLPVSRFASLSLNTTSGTNSLKSPPLSSFASPRSVATVHSPGPPMSAISPNNVHPTMGSLGPNSNYQLTPQHYQRHNYPPVNPADQNPPCNTLYVGNLPMDTSEDELKAMFSKQRGYKRLCFRTKANGPMCFVEFEDVSFATKALNELYGHPLHNSVKGGIRLSFSKNPLGVRTGQNNNNSTSTSSMTSQNTAPGMGSGLGMTPGGFSTATGPPPGLAPPGMTSPVGGVGSVNGSSSFGMFSNGSFGLSGNSMRSQPLSGGMAATTTSAFGGMSNGYSDYMMGR
ncbi:RNA binding protein [Phyllosticta citribraziliensis]|uniref:RNA binding protein n=1 Tax=Phyllosticta citribraziliensis TaxID=989973 RepID=A0ABR1LQ36_9PEZI